MKRARTTRLIGVLCGFLCIFFFVRSPWALDLDKEGKLTLDELIAGAKKEGRLVWYSSGPVSTIKEQFERFNKLYPFIKCDFVKAGGLEIAQRFYAEKSGNIETMDNIASGADEIYPDWRKKGYLARLDNLPEWENLVDLAKGKYGYRVATSYGTQVLAWNGKVYKNEEVPADLWEFTKPEWKNKTASGDPTMAGFGLQWFSFASDVRPKDPRSKAGPSGLGFKWMTAMRENGLMLAGRFGNLSEAVVSGRRPIAIHQFDWEVWLSNKQGANIGWKNATQGTLVQFMNMAVNSKAPHPYAARLFTNWLLTKETQIWSIENHGHNAVRKDIDTSNYIKGRKPLPECWALDTEEINPDESRDFMRKLNDALRGK